jgi:hypothetical protein
VRLPRAKDFYAGLIFIAFGVIALLIGKDYTMGNATRMGPGYFPRMLGLSLCFLGAVISARGLIAAEGPVDRTALKPFLVILAIVAFAMALQPLGLVVAIVLLIVISAMAGHEFRWGETLVLAIALAAMSLVVFVWGLGLQFKVWPV